MEKKKYGSRDLIEVAVNRRAVNILKLLCKKKILGLINSD